MIPHPSKAYSFPSNDPPRHIRIHAKELEKSRHIVEINFNDFSKNLHGMINFRNYFALFI